MKHKQELLNIVGAAAITVVTYEVLIKLLPYQTLSGLETQFGSRQGFVLFMGIVSIIWLLSSLPSFFMLRQQGLVAARSTAIVGVIVAFPLSFILTYCVEMVLPWWSWTLGQFLSALAGFLAVNYIARRIHRRKV